MHRARFFSLIFLALIATGAQAQTRSVPQPDGRLLRLGTDSLDVYIVRFGKAERTGFLVERLDTVRVDGETRLRRVIRTSDTVLGSGVDTLINVWQTLEPRSVRTRSDRGNESLDWKPTRVRGVVEELDKPARSVDSAVPKGWHSSASFDLILRASPLAEGYEVAVPSFSGLDGSRVLTAKVTGSESRDDLGDAWQIEADFADLQVTLWISKTSRKVLREVMHVSPGMEIMYVATRRASASSN